MSEEYATTPGAVEMPQTLHDSDMADSAVDEEHRSITPGRLPEQSSTTMDPASTLQRPEVEPQKVASSSRSSPFPSIEEPPDMARLSQPITAASASASSPASRASPSVSTPTSARTTTASSKPKPKAKAKVATKGTAKGKGKAVASGVEASSTPPSTIPASKKKKTSSGAAKVTASASASSAAASTSAEAALLAKKELEKERKRVKQREARAAAAAAAAAAALEEANGEEEEVQGADEDEEDNKLYCICQTLYDEERMMIQCDRCDEWYHTSCMKMDDSQAELVDMFICISCEPSTSQRTTWKQRCARPTCTHAALLPLSRYCSQRCGVLQAASRISKTKQARAGQPDRLFGRRIKAAQLTEGIVVWAGAGQGIESQVMVEPQQHHTEQGKELPSALVEEWFERVGDLWGPKGTWEPTDPSLMRLSRPQKPRPLNGTHPADAPDVLNEHVRLTPQSSKEDEEILILRSRLSALLSRRSDVNAHLDVLSSRLKLLHLADDRAAGLPLVRLGEENAAAQAASSASSASATKKAAASKKKSSASAAERTGPRCGYDERLHWDDEAFEAWAARGASREMLDDRQDLDGWLSDAPPGYVQPSRGPEAEGTALPVVCGTAKRKCKRHLDWSVVRGADFEVERDVQTNILSSLAAEEQAVRQRIETLQRAVSDRKAAEAEKDAALAAALAKSGDRRAARGLL